jgi:hypothetical protein
MAPGQSDFGKITLCKFDPWVIITPGPTQAIYQHQKGGKNEAVGKA